MGKPEAKGRNNIVSCWLGADSQSNFSGHTSPQHHTPNPAFGYVAMESSISAVLNAFSKDEDEATWSPMDRALSGVITVLNAPSNFAMFSYVEQLRRIKHCVAQSINSPRSALQKTAVTLLTTAARTLGSAFAPLAVEHLPSLLILCGKASIVMVRLASSSIEEVIVACGSGVSGFAAICLAELKKGAKSSKLLRIVSVDAVRYVVSTLNPRTVSDTSKMVESVQETIRLAVTDSANEVREAGRKTFRVYSDIFGEDRVAKFASTLPPQIQKSLHLKPTKKPSTSSIEISRAKELFRKKQEHEFQRAQELLQQKKIQQQLQLLERQQMFQEPQQQPQVVSPLASTPSMTSLRVLAQNTNPLPSRSNRSSWYIERQASGLDDEDAFESFAGDAFSLLDGEAPPMHFGDLDDLVAPVGETAFGAISFTIPVNLGRSPSVHTFQTRSADDEGSEGGSARAGAEFVDDNDAEIANLVSEIRRLEALQPRQPRVHHEQHRQFSSDSSMRSSVVELPADGVTLDLEFAKVTSPQGEIGGEQNEEDEMLVSSNEAVVLVVANVISDGIASVDASLRDEEEGVTLHSPTSPSEIGASEKVPSAANQSAVRVSITENRDYTSALVDEPVEQSSDPAVSSASEMQEKSEKYAISAKIETFDLEISQQLDASAMPECVCIGPGVHVDVDSAEGGPMNLERPSIDPASVLPLQLNTYSDSNGNPEAIILADRTLYDTLTVEVVVEEDEELCTAVEDCDPAESFTHASDGMDTVDSIEGGEGTVAESETGETGDAHLKEELLQEEKQDTIKYKPAEVSEAFPAPSFQDSHVTEAWELDVAHEANSERLEAPTIERVYVKDLAEAHSKEMEAAPQKSGESEDLRSDSGADNEEAGQAAVNVMASEAAGCSVILETTSLVATVVPNDTVSITPMVLASSGRSSTAVSLTDTPAELSTLNDDAEPVISPIASISSADSQAQNKSRLSMLPMMTRQKSNSTNQSIFGAAPSMSRQNSTNPPSMSRQSSHGHTSMSRESSNSQTLSKAPRLAKTPSLKAQSALPKPAASADKIQHSSGYSISGALLPRASTGSQTPSSLQPSKKVTPKATPTATPSPPLYPHNWLRNQGSPPPSPPNMIKRQSTLTNPTAASAARASPIPRSQVSKSVSIHSLSPSSKRNSDPVPSARPVNRAATIAGGGLRRTISTSTIPAGKNALTVKRNNGSQLNEKGKGAAPSSSVGTKLVRPTTAALSGPTPTLLANHGAAVVNTSASVGDECTTSPLDRAKSPPIASARSMSSNGLSTKSPLSSTTAEKSMIPVSNLPVSTTPLSPPMLSERLPGGVSSPTVRRSTMVSPTGRPMPPVFRHSRTIPAASLTAAAVETEADKPIDCTVAKKQVSWHEELHTVLGYSDTDNHSMAVENQLRDAINDGVDGIWTFLESYSNGVGSEAWSMEVVRSKLDDLVGAVVKELATLGSQDATVVKHGLGILKSALEVADVDNDIGLPKASLRDLLKGVLACSASAEGTDESLEIEYEVSNVLEVFEMRLPFSKIISIVSEVLAGVSATIVSGSDQSDGPSSVSEQRTCFEILARVLDTTVRSRPSSLIKANISDFLDSGTFAPPSADAMQAVEWNVLTAQVAAGLESKHPLTRKSAFDCAVALCRRRGSTTELYEYVLEKSGRSRQIVLKGMLERRLR